jgi:hypothetical protein
VKKWIVICLVILALMNLPKQSGHLVHLTTQAQVLKIQRENVDPTISIYLRSEASPKCISGCVKIISLPPVKVSSYSAPVRPRSYNYYTPHPVYTVSNVAGGVWACIRSHESGGNYADNTGNGYWGAYQFLPRTWWVTMSWMGLGTFKGGVYSGAYSLGYLAPPSIQDKAAVTLQSHSGWSQWSTARLCGV